MDKLVNILKEETESLKNQFLESTEKWAKNQYKILEDRNNFTNVQWCEVLGIEPELRMVGGKEILSFPKNFYNTKDSKTLHNLQNTAQKATQLGEDKYVQLSIKKAEEHYENSILKLADRVKKHGLDIDNITAETSHIGVNIETVISDGEKAVKAHTIIAGGAVQKPHYRYLINKVKNPKKYIKSFKEKRDEI